MRLAPGTELLGPWQGSAYRVAPYLIRRADGQHVQVSALLYQLATSIGSDADPDELAARMSGATGREISPENVMHLLRTKLGPLGILTSGDDPPAAVVRANPLLALRFRAAVVPARAHRRVTTALTFLFWPPLVAAALVALAAADVWIGIAHRSAMLGGAKQIIAHPALLLALVAMTLAAAVIHETGHATATRAGGATPGVMGAGIYLVWPVFYTDITDSYRLGRGGRLRADLGGVYFNALTLLAASAAYGLTHWPLLLVFIGVTHVEVLSQFLPFVRLDGYWVVSDLIGVPNLFAYLGPTLAKLLRKSNPAVESRLSQIKPWARRVITGWVAATAVVLGLNALLLALLGPVLITTAAKALAARGQQLAAALGHQRIVVGADDLVSMVFLALPALGMAYMAGLFVARGGRVVLRWRRTRPLIAGACALAAAALCVYQGYAVAGSLGSHPAPPKAVYQTSATPRPDAARAPGGGTWTVGPNGAVTTTGPARLLGSAATIRLAAPTVAIAATPDGGGYWLAGADGGVFAFGDARFYGSVANIHLNGPVVSIQSTTDGHGYWLAASDGGVFAFGDARFYGSLGDLRNPPPVVGLAAPRAGNGYWLATARGGVFAFGAVEYMGGGRVPSGSRVTAITASGTGYQLHTPAGLAPLAAPVTPRTSAPGEGRGSDP